MKYPTQQFSILVECLKTLSNYIDIKAIDTNRLHYIVATQYNEGQTHNHLIVSNGELKRQCSLINEELVKNEGELLKFPEYDFKLYPEGCNDNHIHTAVKKAIKLINKNL